MATHPRRFGRQRADAGDPGTSLPRWARNAGGWGNRAVWETAQTAVRPARDGSARCCKPGPRCRANMERRRAPGAHPGRRAGSDRGDERDRVGTTPRHPAQVEPVARACRNGRGHGHPQTAGQPPAGTSPSSWSRWSRRTFPAGRLRFWSPLAAHPLRKRCWRGRPIDPTGRCRVAAGPSVRHALRASSAYASPNAWLSRPMSRLPQ